VSPNVSPVVNSTLSLKLPGKAFSLRETVAMRSRSGVPHLVHFTRYLCSSAYQLRLRRRVTSAGTAEPTNHGDSFPQSSCSSHTRAYRRALFISQYLYEKYVFQTCLFIFSRLIFSLQFSTSQDAESKQPPNFTSVRDDYQRQVSAYSAI